MKYENDLLKNKVIIETVPSSWTVSKLQLIQMGFYKDTEEGEVPFPKLLYYLFEILCCKEYEEDLYDELKNEEDVWHDPINKRKLVRNRYSDDIEYNSAGYFNAVYSPFHKEHRRISNQYGNPMTLPMIQKLLRIRYNKDYGSKTLTSGNFKSRRNEFTTCERRVSINWFRIKGFPDTFWTLADDGYGRKGKLETSYYFDSIPNIIRKYSELQLKLFYELYPLYQHYNPSPLKVTEYRKKDKIELHKFFLDKDYPTMIKDFLKKNQKK